MIINENGSVQLDTEDRFVCEKQDEGNIWRTATYLMGNGAYVTVQRHFSTIGPLITNADGTRVETTYDRDSNSVIEITEAVRLKWRLADNALAAKYGHRLPFPELVS